MPTDSTSPSSFAAAIISSSDLLFRSPSVEVLADAEEAVALSDAAAEEAPLSAADVSAAETGASAEAEFSVAADEAADVPLCVLLCMPLPHAVKISDILRAAAVTAANLVLILILSFLRCHIFSLLCHYMADTEESEITPLSTLC